MAFEMTLVRDGCSKVLDAGQDELELQSALVRLGGRVLVPEGRVWRDSYQPEAIAARRHLCAKCAGVTELFNGERVCAPSEED